MQCVAVAPAQQSGAVVDLMRQALGRQRGGGVGQRGEPGAEGGAVGGRVQAEEVGRAVAKAVAGVGGEMERYGDETRRGS